MISSTMLSNCFHNKDDSYVVHPLPYFYFRPYHTSLEITRGVLTHAPGTPFCSVSSFFKLVSVLSHAPESLFRSVSSFYKSVILPGQAEKLSVSRVHKYVSLYHLLLPNTQDNRYCD